METHEDMRQHWQDDSEKEEGSYSEVIQAVHNGKVCCAMIYLSLPKLINLYLSFIFQIGRGQCWQPKFPLCTALIQTSESFVMCDVISVTCHECHTVKGGWWTAHIVSNWDAWRDSHNGLHCMLEWMGGMQMEDICVTHNKRLCIKSFL